MSIYHTILGKKSLKRFSQLLSLLIISVSLLLTSSGLAARTASADVATTTPPTQLPTTVSDDPLPTVQTNGVVWDSVVAGNRVFVTGDFSTARPAGSAPGNNEVSRSNLLAFDINTGVLDTSFNHSLNGVGHAITASPDGKRLYVGGSFTEVDGLSRYRIAAFDLTTNQMVSSFKKGTLSTIASLAASNTTVYAGGNFTQGTDGVTHNRLMAFNTNGDVLTAWNPSADANVAALLLTTDGSRLIVGGSFSHLNGQQYHALGALNPTTGAALPWASQSNSFPIRVDIDGAGITALATDGQQVYLSSYNFHARNDPGGFEGRAAINQTNGNLIWMNDCHGDTYDAFPMNGVLYSVGHAHDCMPAGAFPDTNPRTYYRALAETTYTTGVNTTGTEDYWNFAGQPRSTQLNWYPAVTPGTETGQAGWTLTGNGDYLVMAGDFPTVDGVAQQNIVRFAVRSKAPNKSAPHYYGSNAIKTEAAASDGTAVVSWQETYDRDDANLTYTLYRDGTLINTQTKASKFWALKSLRYVDRGLQPGSTHRYKLVATDPYGNYTYIYATSATGCHLAHGSVNTLCAGEVLTNGQAIYSQNGLYELHMRVGGDLELTTRGDRQLWHSNTDGRDQSKFAFQTDGNAVVYPVRGGVSWTSSTANRNGAYITLRNDGNLVIYNSSNQQIWATNTIQN